MKTDVRRGRRYRLVIWNIALMNRCLAAFATAASLYPPIARANDALETTVRAYAPVVSLAKVCDIELVRPR